MTGSLLWYAHDVGYGHLQRCAAVLPHLEMPVTLASSHPGVAALLAAPEPTRGRDRPARLVSVLRSDRVSGAPEGRGPLHYTPVDRSARDRVRDVLDTIERDDCTTAVVDVSCETAVLCRLAGLRTIVLRQSGRRTDPGHALAHDCADVVWVPQHERLEPHIGQTKRFSYSGAFSRYDDRRLETCPLTNDPRRGSVRKRVVVVLGAGGSAFPERTWTQGGSAAGVDVVVLGSKQRWAAGAVQSLGHVDDPRPGLRAADAVISSAGWASVHDLASLGIPNAVVAEARPFDEQTVRAAALSDAGLVVALDGWPAPANLGAVLEQCDALAPDRWAPFYDGLGAQRAAAIISEVHHGRP